MVIEFLIDMGGCNIYILITPCKNEETSLPITIECVLAQTMKPSLWLIINDNSIDNTLNIIRKYESEVPWIKSLDLNDATCSFSFRFGFVIRNGIDRAIYLARNGDISYEYLGVLDSDVQIGNNYFSSLVDYLNANRNCGIVSGLLHEKDIIDNGIGFPRGGARLYRVDTIKDIGDYPLMPHHENIMDIKALNRGWDVTKIKSIAGFHSRPASSREGIIHGYIKNGEGLYYLNYSPVNAFLSGCYLCLKPPFYTGFAYIYGYFSSYLMNDPQTNDEEIRIYFGNSFKRLLYRMFKIKRFK